MGAGAEIVCAHPLWDLCDTLVQYVACWTIVLLVLWINDVGEYNSIPITLLRTTLHFFLTQVCWHCDELTQSSRILLINPYKLSF
jgi:hypothetical protein